MEEDGGIGMIARHLRAAARSPAGEAKPPPRLSVAAPGSRLRAAARGKLALAGWILMPLAMALSLVNSFADAPWLTPLTLVLAGLSCLLLIFVHLGDNCFVPALWPQTAGPTGPLEVRAGVQGGRAPDLLAEEAGDQPVPAIAEELDRAARASAEREDVQGFLKCVPLLLLVNVSFSLCYNAMNGAMPAQACQMDTQLPWETGTLRGAQLNGSFFSIGDSFSILLLIPVFDGFLFPFLQRCRGGRPVTRRQQLICGLFVAALSNGVAAALEIARRRAPLLDDVSKCAAEGVKMSAISSFWMFVPFGLMGVAEILVNPALLHYAYVKAPEGLRSSVQGFNLVAMGAVPNVFTSALSTAMIPPADLNAGHIEYFYYVNIAFAFLGLTLYLLLFPASEEEGSSSAAGPEAGVEDSMVGEPLRCSLRDGPASFLSGSASNHAFGSLVGHSADGRTAFSGSFPPGAIVQASSVHHCSLPPAPPSFASMPAAPRATSS